MNMKRFKNVIKLIFGFLLIWGIYGLVTCHCVSLKTFTPAAARDYIQGFGKLSVIIYILAYALNTISIFPPIAVLSLTAGLAFGKVWGAIYLMTGALLGTTGTFFISRILGRGFLEELLQGKFRDFDSRLEKKGFLTILFFRVVPVVPYEVINYVSGLSKIKFRDYFFATFLGLIPGVIIAAFFGGTLGEVRRLKDLISVKVALALAALFIVILIPVIYQNFKKGKPHDRGI